MAKENNICKIMLKKTVYNLGGKLLNVRLKTTPRTHVTKIPEGLPHATLTAPNLLVRNYSRFVGHKLSTFLCRCFIGPCKANETIRKTHTKLLLHCPFFLLRTATQCATFSVW